MITEVGDAIARDIFHYDKRQTISSTAIEQPGNVRMVERRQDITLHHKPAHDALSIHAPSNNLERNFLLKAFARGQVNGAHAAATDFLHDSIGANDRAGRDLVRSDHLGPVAKDIPGEKTLSIGV